MLAAIRSLARHRIPTPPVLPVRPFLASRFYATKPSNERPNQEGNGNNKKNSREPGGGDKRPAPIREIAILGAIALSVSLFQNSSSSSRNHEISFQDFLTSLPNLKVDRLVVDLGGRVYIIRQGNFERPYFTIGSVESFERKMREVDPTGEITISYQQENVWLQEIVKLIPTALIIGAIYFLVIRGMGSPGGGRGQGMNGIFDMGKSKPTIITKDSNIKTTFKDVAGLFEAKEEVMEFVHFLRTPEKYERLGARLPKGALLVGPPGTGKTLLAKATAGEAGVPFFSVSGSDFVEMFVGVGSSRVRDLFDQARKNAPCIIFIDEIDAVGRARGQNGMGGNDERENTLNQLLVEMDGFNSKQGAIVVLAGTNRVDILDKALLRPGRFDRQIAIDKPDLRGRVEIFQVHMKPLKLAVQDAKALVDRLSALTPGFSGADIANVCNEAALIAARSNKTSIEVIDFEKAIERVIGGLEKKTKVVSKTEKEIIAYHEAGHAVAGWFLETCDPLLKISIIPRAQATLGFSQALPKEQFLMTTQQLFEMMCMTLGGRAAEVLKFGEPSTGATDDLQKVTRLALAQVTEFGMNGKIGQISFRKNGNEMTVDKPYSETTHQAIDEEVQRLVHDAYAAVNKLLNEKRELLDSLAQFLLQHEVANHEDILRLLGPRPHQVDQKQLDTLALAFGRPVDTTTLLDTNK
eukprot:c7884_g1_i1.p1 GENE.c7884_g1_i1~~c7884_g1_i1.p1  ORF type:complete len:704 (-),score=157.87 c7884_g1_i1:31-2109(-)